MVKKVAVLPFRNISPRKEAGKIITNLFTQELFKSGAFNVVETGNTRDFFVRQRIRKTGEIDLDTIQMMGVQLGLDAVFLGIVEEYYQQEGGKNGISPQVALSVRMINTKTGKIMWKCFHKKNGDDYIFILDWGRISTCTVLAEKVIHEMILTIKDKG